MASGAARFLDHRGETIPAGDRLRETGAAAAARHRRWYARWQRRQLAARDVPPGGSWVFPEHRSLAEIAAPGRAA